MRRVTLCLMLIAIAVATGCATTSDDLIPQSVVLPPDHQLFAGSVRVNTQINNEGIGEPLYELVSLERLASLIKIDQAALENTIGLPNLMFPISMKPFVVFPPFKSETENKKPYTITTLQSSSEFQNVGKVRGDTGYLMGFIKEALEKSLLKDRLFTSVGQGQTDYVLDVWIDRTTAEFPNAGIGTYKADIFSIWRLTRVSDGKVLACDFVLGHGLIDSGMQPLNRISRAVIQDMIGKGMSMLADRSQEHLAAFVPAGITRPVIGGTISRDGERWNERVRQNWPRLQKGMTVAETEAVLGSLRINHPEWDCRYRLLYQKQRGVEETDLTGKGVLEFRIFKTDLYTLVFMSPPSLIGKSLEKHDKILTKILMMQPDPPTLLIWKLNK